MSLLTKCCRLHSALFNPLFFEMYTSPPKAARMNDEVQQEEVELLGVVAGWHVPVAGSQ